MRVYSRHLFFWLITLVGAIIFLSKPVAALSNNQLISMTNQRRTASGLNPLSENNELAQSAAAKANHMLANNYWAHDAPDGTKPWYFIKKSGYEYKAAGENLAKDFNSDASVVEAWMNSPAHKANILSTNYEDVGIAVQSGTLNGQKTTLVVVHYGARNQPAATPQVKAATTKAQPTTEITEAGKTLAFFVSAVSLASGLMLGRHPG